MVRPLAAEAGLLDAAERRRGVGDEAAVEADHAGLDLLGDAQAAGEVAGVDVGDEAELGVVGQGDGLVLGGEAADGGDGAEDLLAGDGGAGGDAVDDGGREVEAVAVERPCRR